MTGFGLYHSYVIIVTHRNQSLVKSEIHHYFIRLTICILKSHTQNIRQQTSSVCFLYTYNSVFANKKIICLQHCILYYKAMVMLIKMKQAMYIMRSTKTMLNKYSNILRKLLSSTLCSLHNHKKMHCKPHDQNKHLI